MASKTQGLLDPSFPEDIPEAASSWDPRMGQEEELGEGTGQVTYFSGRLTVLPFSFSFPRPVVLTEMTPPDLQSAGGGPGHGSPLPLCVTSTL